MPTDFKTPEGKAKAKLWKQAAAERAKAQRTTITKAATLGLSMVTIGRRNRNYGSVAEMKAGAVLDQIRLMKDLGVLFNKKLKDVDADEKKLQLEYGKLLLNIYTKATLAIETIPDFPKPESKPSKNAPLSACPSNMSAAPATLNININDHGIHRNGSNGNGSTEVVLSESGR